MYGEMEQVDGMIPMHFDSCVEMTKSRQAISEKRISKIVVGRCAIAPYEEVRTNE